MLYARNGRVLGFRPGVLGGPEEEGSRRREVAWAIAV